MAVASLSLHAARSSPRNSVQHRRASTERSDVSLKGTATRTVGVHDKTKWEPLIVAPGAPVYKAHRDAKYGSDTVSSIARSRPTAMPSSTSTPSAGTGAASKDFSPQCRRLAASFPVPPAADPHDRLCGTAIECEGQ